MNPKKCFVTVSILFMSTMALADGHSYNVEMMSSCSAYNHSAQMMGELPLQISGSMSCVNYAAKIKGQELTMSGDCTFWSSCDSCISSNDELDRNMQKL